MIKKKTIALILSITCVAAFTPMSFAAGKTAEAGATAEGAVTVDKVTVTEPDASLAKQPCKASITGGITATEPDTSLEKQPCKASITGGITATEPDAPLAKQPCKASITAGNTASVPDASLEKQPCKASITGGITASVPDASLPEETVKGKTLKLADSETLLENYLMKYASKRAAYSAASSSRNTRGSKLKGNDKVVYQQLKSKIEHIANGKLDSSVISIPLSELEGGKKHFTASDLGVESIVAKNQTTGDNEITKEAFKAIVEKYNFDIKKVTNALLADLPYDLYWYDKTKGISAGLDNSLDIKTAGSVDDPEIYISEPENVCWTISLYVAKAYSKTNAEGTTDLNTEKTEAAKTAADNAGNIVKANEGKNDLEKLRAYKQAICDNVSYNAAGLDEDAPYGDLWQMIYVFDNNDQTNVVCEGYAKAFQFLCDISNFQSSCTESHIVTGTMSGGTGAGSHMWNVLHMDDNKNYLVDVTSCDTANPDHSEDLFLKGYASGSVDAGYVYDSHKGDMSYQYDDVTRKLYSDEELKMAAKDYGTDMVCDHEMTKTAARQATCTQEGNTEYWYCSKCDTYFADKDGDETIEENSWVIAEKGHDYQEVAGTAVEATCLKDGKEADQKCSRCNDIIAGAIIEKKGHSWDKGTITKAATASAAGEKTFTCTVCKATRTESVPRLGESADPGAPATTDNPGAPAGNDGSKQPGSDASTQAGNDGSKQLGTDGTALGKGASATAAEQALTSMNKDSDPAGTIFRELQLKSTKQTDKSVRLQWKRAGGAKKYVVFGNISGTKNKLKKIAAVSGTSLNCKKIAGKKIKKSTYYKVIVVAIDGNDKVVSASKIIHVATKGGKAGNCRSIAIKSKKNKMILKKGKKFKLKAKAVPANKKLKVKKILGVRYESSDSRIAAVNGKGVIIAKSKGSCYVYAYAQNGVMKRTKITVK